MLEKETDGIGGAHAAATASKARLQHQGQADCQDLQSDTSHQVSLPLSPFPPSRGLSSFLSFFSLSRLLSLSSVLRSFSSQFLPHARRTHAAQLKHCSLDDMTEDLEQGDCPETCKKFFLASPAIAPAATSTLSLPEVCLYIFVLSLTIARSLLSLSLTIVAR